MEFESVRPSVVKSIKQRDLLNTWLRLYARARELPSLAEYEPERLGDEAPDLIFYAVDAAIASLKAISVDGGFEIKNLMRGLDTLPEPKLLSVIDYDLFHRTPSRIEAGDVIEFI